MCFEKRWKKNLGKAIFWPSGELKFQNFPPGCTLVDTNLRKLPSRIKFFKTMHLHLWQVCSWDGANQSAWVQDWGGQWLGFESFCLSSQNKQFSSLMANHMANNVFLATEKNRALKLWVKSSGIQTSLAEWNI